MVNRRRSYTPPVLRELIDGDGWTVVGAHWVNVKTGAIVPMPEPDPDNPDPADDLPW